MQIGRPVAKIELTENQRKKLELIASRAKTSQRDSLRARRIQTSSEYFISPFATTFYVTPSFKKSFKSLISKGF